MPRLRSSSARATRSSIIATPKRISSRLESENIGSNTFLKRDLKSRPVNFDASVNSSADENDAPAPKRRKPQLSRRKTANPQLDENIFGPSGKSISQTCLPPARRHDVMYHRPLLLDDVLSRQALLDWFDRVSAKRAMPWRKAWINPLEYSNADELRSLLERRAYEVWVSEVMLQQTRVAVVIDYWNRWMAKWPTIQDVAAAESEDVLSAWRGLGYYSRATRIHEAAKLVAQDSAMKGLLPADTEELQAKIPGVGRYTAGAISAIVFGRASPMVDGNVLRVLSRQLGLLGNAKTDKLIIDTLWAAASALVKAVAQDASTEERKERENAEMSNRPGRWGQALMELGSTICTPKPNCSECPVISTCRAYNEGKLLASVGVSTHNASKHVDMEDFEKPCHLCDHFEDAMSQDTDAFAENGPEVQPKPSKSTRVQSRPGKQTSLSAFMFQSPAIENPFSPKPNTTLTAREMERIIDHARKFPLKSIKKLVRTEETLVCVIRDNDGHYLIQKRPEKGLLANMWEFPSNILNSGQDHTPESRRSSAISFVSSVISKNQSKWSNNPPLEHAQDLGDVPWLFSHIKLTMHVHVFTLNAKHCLSNESSQSKWVSSDAIERESMGTGMRKCWAVVKESMTISGKN